MRLAACFVALVLLSQLAVSQTTPAPGKAAIAPAAQESSAVLEYAKFLREEDKSHREYLEKLYAITLSALGLLVTVGIGVAGFFLYKSPAEIKAAVDAKFNDTVELELQRRLTEFTRQLDTAKQGLEDRVEALKSRIAEVEPAMRLMVDEQIDPAEAQAEAAAEPVAAQPLPAPYTGSTPPPTSDEKTVLIEIGDSKFSFRTFIGIAQGAAKRGVPADAVPRHLQALTDKGYVGKTLGKKGGERWYVTEAGRRFLMSPK